MIRTGICAVAEASTPNSRPGMTSLIRTSRGLMTVQTELVGEPAELLTIVDFRGRVLKRWTSDFRVDQHSLDAPARIREWHNQIETKIRNSLAAATRKRAQAGPSQTGQVVGELFVRAMEAYAQRDFETAAAVLEACDQLLPNEPRVRAARAQLALKLDASNTRKAKTP